MLRRAGAVAAAALALIVAVVVVGRGARGPRVLLDSDNGILAAAESEARGARTLAGDAPAAKASESAVLRPVPTKTLSRAQVLQQEVKDMAEMQKIRTYSGGGSKILAEAQKEEKTLKALADLKEAGVQHQQLKTARSKAALKEASPKATEHSLAREEELVDCEPFCDTQELSESRKAAHARLLKDQARQRMQQRAKLSKAKTEEAAEEQAHCIFCKPAAVHHRLRALRGPVF
jgi:hypothetical protein